VGVLDKKVEVAVVRPELTCILRRSLYAQTVVECQYSFVSYFKPSSMCYRISVVIYYL